MPENATPTNDPIATNGHTALDDLFKGVTGDNPPPGDKSEETPPPATPPTDKGTPPPATPEPKKDEQQAPPPGTPPGDKGTPPPATPPPTDFEKVELPPYSKPKTGEAFETVKKLAREQLSAKDAEIEKLKQDLTDRDTKLKAGPPQELTKELEELRNFRRSADIESDPEFRSKFDGRIETNNTSIRAKLTEFGMTKEQFDEIEKLGGFEKIEWDPILKDLPGPAKRFIESKLVSNEDLRNEKKTEVEKARKNPTVFETQKAEGQSRRIVETANGFLEKMSWTAERPVPANAKPEEKAKIEADNAFAQETQARLKEALKSYSPENYAEAVIATQMAYKFQRDIKVLEASSKVTETKLAEATKRADALQKELDDIKAAGQTHRRGSATPPPPVINNLIEDGRSALDRLREQGSN